MLAGLGVFLSTQELRTLNNHFDHNKDGCVSYDEFIQTMRVSNSYSINLRLYYDLVLRILLQDCLHTSYLSRYLN